MSREVWVMPLRVQSLDDAVRDVLESELDLKFFNQRSLGERTVAHCVFPSADGRGMLRVVHDPLFPEFAPRARNRARSLWYGLEDEYPRMPWRFDSEYTLRYSVFGHRLGIAVRSAHLAQAAALLDQAEEAAELAVLAERRKMVAEMHIAVTRELQEQRSDSNSPPRDLGLEVVAPRSLWLWLLVALVVLALAVATSFAIDLV